MIYIFLILISCLIVLYSYKRRNLYKFARNFDGPLAFPIIGAGHHFMGVKSTEFTLKLVEFIKIYKSPVAVWLGPKLVLIINEADDIQDVLSSQNTITKEEYFYNVLNYIGSKDGEMTSLITSPVQEWKRDRKLLNPCFSNNIIKSYFPIFNEECDYMIQLLKTKLGSPAFDLLDIVQACGLDITCSKFFLY